MSHFCKNKVDYDNAVSMLRVYFTLNCAGQDQAALLVQIYTTRGHFLKTDRNSKSTGKMVGDEFRDRDLNSTMTS